MGELEAEENDQLAVFSPASGDLFLFLKQQHSHKEIERYYRAPIFGW